MLRQLGVGVLALLLVGCNEKPVRVIAQPPPVVTTVAVPTTSPAPSPTPKPNPKPKPRARATTSPAPPTPTPVRTTAPAARRTCPGLSGVSGTQVLLVVGSGSSATARLCEKREGAWLLVRAPMPGHVGRNGIAPPGAKREGDGRTPGGTFVLGRGFGQSGNPGVSFRWTVVDSHDVWVDDVRSSLYNSWQRTPADGRWATAEPLLQRYYALAQVVDYNTARVAGKGSGIFLHLDHASGTAGCITLQRSDLLAVFRWERPGARIVIR